ncbi:hypothetical protein [Prauserella cavernicola]|uniref:Uncharacterized protein n=1 Tax=Prauserella cavernicola TaxID=2800127 RepID=A0A934V3E2_9PSEU|nr:hypothetical protein [Prauserella cavernicola]MBK1783579.1 hypothetical protein [Prauserella cavernicola]
MNPAGMRTPAMERAERELDARIDHAYAVMYEAEAEIEQLERDFGVVEPPSDEDVERVRAFVLGHGRTPEWTPVLDRVEEGVLTWRQIVEGLATGSTGREIAAAFASLSRVPPADADTLVAIGVARETEPEPQQEPDDEPGRPRRRIVRFGPE